jgi:hypothetical protein
MESNYNETNGIVVGPEVSRILAEIILQKVDDNILKNLSGQSVRSPEDYSILRYVDDYFVFSNDFKVRDRVIDVIKHELSLIKLYINERKSVSFDKPFMTKESNAKIETSIAIDRFFEGITKDEKYNTKTRPRMATNYLVQELKKCASSNDIPFSSISRYTLQVLIKRSLILLKKSIDENLSLSDITYYLINVIFVLYSYDSNYRTTNIICLFFLDLFESFRRKDKVLTAEMARVFFEQATNHIKYKVVRSENIGIEEWNLILVLSEVWQYEKIESDVLLSWLKNSKKYHSDEACYFTIIVGLYYSSDRGEYEHVRSHFVKIITEFLNNSFKKNQQS